jgi:hypothetical protein
MGATTYFHNSLQHLLHELARIDLLISWAVQQLRVSQDEPRDEMHGFYVPDAEIDAILRGDYSISPGFSSPELASENATSLLSTLSITRHELDEIISESHRRGITLRLPTLIGCFGLTEFEQDLLLLALASEMDLKYERLYAYLQDDVHRKRPTVDLVLNLLCPSYEAKLTKRQYFSVTSPLFRHQLLLLGNEPAEQQSSILRRSLRVDERVVNYLLGSDEVDARLLPYVHPVAPATVTPLEQLLLPPEIKDRLALLAQHPPGTAKIIYYFQGHYGVGKQTTAKALCR